SGYFADINAMSANGYVSMTVTYGIKEIWKENVTDMAVRIFIPSNSELNVETLKVDDVLCTNYNYDDSHILTIPVDEPNGQIKFSVKVVQQGDLNSYASLSAKKEGVANNEIIGILNESIETLTLNAPEKTGKNTVSVSGTAPASAKITLSVEGEGQGRVTAS